MKTILILETSLDLLRLTKDDLVVKFIADGNLKRYGDDFVETNDDQVYFIKVISLAEYRTKLMQIIGRGYDEIQMDNVKNDVAGLLKSLNLTVLSHKTAEITEKDLEPNAGKIEAVPSVLDENKDKENPAPLASGATGQ